MCAFSPEKHYLSQVLFLFAYLSRSPTNLEPEAFFLISIANETLTLVKGSGRPWEDFHFSGICGSASGSTCIFYVVTGHQGLLSSRILCRDVEEGRPSGVGCPPKSKRGASAWSWCAPARPIPTAGPPGRAAPPDTEDQVLAMFGDRHIWGVGAVSCEFLAPVTE